MIQNAVPNKEWESALPVTMLTGPKKEKNANMKKMKINLRELPPPASECSGLMDTTQQHAWKVKVRIDGWTMIAAL